MGGFFGAVSRENCAADVFYGTDYHSHLGTHRGGMAFWAGGVFHRTIHDISNAQFRTRFGDDFSRFDAMDPRAGIGVISDTDDQPHIFLSHLGRYSIVTVGKVANAAALIEGLVKEHAAHFSSLQSGEIMQTEVVAALINTRNSIPEGLRHVQEVVEGSISILLLAPDNVLWAMRDKSGRTPIALGRKASGWAASFESSAFPNLGYSAVRDLGPGEIVRLSPDGPETVVEARPAERLCAFLHIYYGFPASSYGGANVERARYRCGAALAASAPVEADIVAGIPDSGIGHALGFSDASGIRYARPFVKYTPTWARSFMPQNQAERQHVANMKLIPIPDLVKGKRIVLCDDSIVRGTQLKNQAKRLFDIGAKEIHVRIACPPLLYGCRFINFSDSKSEMELITRRVIRDMDGDGADVSRYFDPDGEPYRRMVDRIREQLGLTSLAFQRLPDLVAAVSGAESGGRTLCTHCWSGDECAPARV
ncbi:MAG: amidophosphoribosyltransferase [Kiritimatiellae bacterium]|nr:amidophosphoribosyltransferase [Kiritimatiellia bacterium]